MKPTKVICRVCGREFIAKDPRKMYCSQKCNGMAQKRKACPNPFAWKNEERTCTFCGIKFNPNTNFQKFCSEHCKNTYANLHREETQKTCPTCGKVFYTKQKKAKYCCIACGLKGSIPVKKLKCVDCGTEFEFHGRTRRLRCDACSGKHRLDIVHRMIERKSDPYREKIKTLPDGKQHRYRALCYSMWEKKCAICGKDGNERYSVDVHHIDGNVENMSADNLIPLCRMCHRAVHRLGRSIGLKEAVNRLLPKSQSAPGASTK